MPPRNRYLLSILLALPCIALILLNAVSLQTAARVMDAGFRPLGSAISAPPEGPIYLENDSYYWLRMAERMDEEGVARIRYTMADNAPFGRPVYWSQSIPWMIHGVASLPGISSAKAPLVAASFWVNPILHSILILAIIFLLQPFGSRLAFLVGLLMVCVGDVQWAFSSLRPDHQSIQAASVVLLLVMLATVGFGYGKPSFGELAETRSIRNVVFALGGIITGIGLWVSAAAMMPVLLALSGLMCLTALFWCPKPIDLPAAQRGWLTWGAAAGITSLIFWLIEFAPNLGASRLEVNNPAFSIWVFALGVAVARSMAVRWSEGREFVKNAVILGIVAVICGSLPAIILFGPTEWYLPRAVYMDRLHNFIMEFYTYKNFVKGDVLMGLAKTFQLLGPLALLLVVPAIYSKDAALRMVARILLLVTLAIFFMAMRQIRWFALATPVMILAASFSTYYFVRLIEQRQGSPKVLGNLLYAAVILQGVFFAAVQMAGIQPVVGGKSLLSEMVQPILNKRFAIALRDSPSRPTAVLADPDLAPSLQYFARIPAVSSFYWENLDGARAMTDFLADSQGDIALQIAKDRGLSHVIVPSGHLLSNYVFFIQNGHYDRQKASKNLGAALANSGTMPIPGWLATDFEIERIGKLPFKVGGETIEQYLNVYRINLDQAEN
jgi:hypothetical protein